MTDPGRRAVSESGYQQGDFVLLFTVPNLLTGLRVAAIPSDGDLLLLTAADFDCGSGDGVYCCERDGLV